MNAIALGAANNKVKSNNRSDEQILEETQKSNSDEIIILPFFSDEVLSLEDIPKDENWNFVEINSATDLLAMENPHQKTSKTQGGKAKSRHEQNQETKQKPYNNWIKFKDVFPIFIDKYNKPKTKTSKKQKRQAPLISGSDPWASVNIIEDPSNNLSFGAYNELGTKWGNLKTGQLEQMKPIKKAANIL